jgi:signal transduction histidine kinase
MPRLRDVRIQSKLGLILLVPLLAVVTLSAVRLFDAGKTLVDARQVNATTNLASKAAALVQQLQRERLAAGELLLVPRNAANRNDLRNAYSTQATKTDTAAAVYASQRDKVSGVTGEVANDLNLIDQELVALGKNWRTNTMEQADETVASATFRYTVLIGELLDFRQAVSQLAGQQGLSNQIRAAGAVSRAKEFAAQEQISVLRVLGNGGFDGTSFGVYLGTLTNQQQAYNDFFNSADGTQQSILTAKVNGTKVADSTTQEQDVSSTPVGQKLDITAAGWNKAMGARIDALRDAEQQIDGTVQAHAQAQVDSVVRQVISESAAVLAVLVLALLLALLVARSMARSLRRLREGALQVAYESLPQAVARLRSAESIGELTPEQLASQVRDPVAVRGRDEIGQVSQAFNVVHREAVRVAAEQASLRASVSTMFVNLARRSQLLVDRLIGHLDRLEQGEEDPDRLAQLFQLDHLATRMRRNDENLLVLAGADSTRARREAAPLGDVLRAAQSEVEQYTRIEFGIVDRDVEVTAAADNDVVHLIAELLDNATSFSGPDTAVVVDARRVGDRAIVQVEDRGIGMSQEQLDELNERLANPPLVDVAVSRMMGLVVVGRLASRLGIQVELRRATERGTVADVVLPASVLMARTRGGRLPVGVPAPSAPLALESTPLEPTVRSFGQPGIGQAPYQPPSRPDLADAAGHLGGLHRGPNGTGGPGGPGAGGPGTGSPAGNGLPGTGLSGLPRRAPGNSGMTNGNGAATGSLFESADRDDDAGPDQLDRPAQPDPRGRPDRPGRPDGSDLPSRSDRAGSDEQATSAWPTIGRTPGTSLGPAFGASAGPWRGPDAPGGPTGGPGGPTRGPGAPAPADALPQTGGLPRRQPGQPTTPPVGEPLDSSATMEHPSVRPAGSRPAGDEATDPGRSRLDSAQPGARSGPPAAANRNEIIPRNVDDTMELPIFREVESAWFRTSPSRPRTDLPAAKPSAPSDTRPPAGPAAGRPGGGLASGLPSRAAGTGSGTGDRTAPTPIIPKPIIQRPAARDPEPSAAMAPPEAPETPAEPADLVDPWRTAADIGWRRASAAAAHTEPSETTRSGLPKRRPMAQLVPGAVEPPAAAGTGQRNTRERSPEQVRGLLSAYHRGVQRGRSGGANTRPVSVPGSNSTDKEREA